MLSTGLADEVLRLRQLSVVLAQVRQTLLQASQELLVVLVTVLPEGQVPTQLLLYQKAAGSQVRHCARVVQVRQGKEQARHSKVVLG